MNNLITALYSPLEKNRFASKDDFVLNHCDSKIVLHVGCTDYPITEYRIERNELLHEKINQKSNELYGLDLSKEGINSLKKHGYKNLIIGDASKLEIHNDLYNKFDVIVAGDIIEHMSNIGEFFDSAKKLIVDDGKIIITVPNAFYFYRFIKIGFGTEIVHKDHVCYFSPKTLSCLANRHGYYLHDLQFFENKSQGLIEKVLNNLYFRKKPYFSHSFGIVISKCAPNKKSKKIIS